MGTREKIKRNILETEKLNNKEDRTKKKTLDCEKRYRVLFDKMLNGFALCKLLTDKKYNPIDYIFLKVNRAFEKINSTKKKEVINKKVSNVSGFKVTGCGIAEENLKKIFHPFFTTRKDGTGLGLSICQMIINEHKGNISAESKLGEGTTFTILLPLDRRRRR